MRFRQTKTVSPYQEVKHNTRRRLEKQVADEDRKLKLDVYSQNQEEINCMKKQLEQQEQQLSNYERTKTNLERQNAELNQTMVGLQNTLDRAFKQGK
jgi:U3 small nucleolar ribonucleoprotein component